MTGPILERLKEVQLPMFARGMLRRPALFLWLLFLIGSVPFGPALSVSGADRGGSDWPWTARLAGGSMWPEMSDADIRKRLEELDSQNVNTVDVDISFLYRTDKALDFLSRLVPYTRSNYPDMRLFVYIAPLEWVSRDVDMNMDGQVDPYKYSVFTTHPEWLQVGIDGRPAVFYGNVAFWVGEHDEDVRLCPNDPVYAEQWREKVRQLAGSGVDAVFVDVPFFVFSFGEGWRDQWTCHCSDCQAKFTAETGLAIPAEPDWGDRAWQEWVQWRYDQIDEFLGTIRAEARAVNPEIKLVVEHWDGVQSPFTMACHAVGIRPVSDVRCHEWTAMGGSATNYRLSTWIADLCLYHLYREIDRDEASWILCYADKGDVHGSGLMAATVLATGCNFWESDAPHMSGTVDEDHRRRLFGWIREHEELYYDPGLEPYSRIALFYPKRSVDYYDGSRYRTSNRGAFAEFLGLAMMLAAEHIPFRVIFDDDLDDLGRFDLLILPNAACLSTGQVEAVRGYVSRGGRLLATGETSRYDEWGVELGKNALGDLFGFDNIAPGYFLSDHGAGRTAYTGQGIGANYYLALEPRWSEGYEDWADAGETRQTFMERLWRPLGVESVLISGAPPEVALMPAVGENRLVLRAVNYLGVKPGAQKPGAVRPVTVRLTLPSGKSAASAVAHEFLGGDGEVQLALTGPHEVRFQFPLGVHTAVSLELIDTVPGRTDVPNRPLLSPARPNPFLYETELEYSVDRAGPISIKVYNIRGEEVRTLAALHREPGFYRVPWDGLTQSGERTPSGIYLVRFAGRGFSEVNKVVLIR